MIKNKVVKISLLAFLILALIGLGFFLFMQGLSEQKNTSSSSSLTVSSSSSSRVSSSSSEEEPQPDVKVEDKKLAPAEAKLQSYIFNGDEITDEGQLSNLSENLKAMLATFDGKSFEDINKVKSGGNFKLAGTDSTMIMTVYLFFQFQKYSLDESYIKAWTSKPDHIVQVIFRGKADNREGVYFLAYFDTKAGNFEVSMREGGVVDATFG